jgi:hypothetical protein
VEHIKVVSIGSSLTANIRLGWKGLPETNAPAYENSKIAAVESFIGLAPESSKIGTP